MTTPSYPAGSARDLGATATPYTQPFSVQGSCVLSEDYFLTDKIIMNAADIVRPFVRADGTVEALILSGGVVSHLRRSVTATSGWTCTPLPAPANVPPALEPVDIATVTAHDGTVWALVLRRFTGTELTVMMSSLLSLGSSGAWEDVQDSDLPQGGLGRLQSGLDRDGNVYFYAFYLTSQPGQPGANGTFLMWQPQSGNHSPVPNSSLRGVDMVDARLLWDPAGQGAVVCLTSQNVMEWYDAQGADSPDSFEPAGTGQTADVEALLWTGWVDYQNPDFPGVVTGYAYQVKSGDIMFSTPESSTIGDADLGTFTSQVGQDKVAVWQDGSGLFGFAFLVGDTVEIISEYGNPGSIPLEITAPIPLQPDVTAVFSQPADVKQGTLFVVLADATLNVLAKDPVAGWSLVPVQQDTATLQELDTWRVQLSVTDANGAAVAGAQLSVSADRPAGTWQANSSTLLGLGSPATFTADTRGRVTFATPAVELDAPQLTVQVVPDDSSVAAAAPVAVSPDADAHAFLAGAAPLNDLGSLSASALLQAKRADGTSLCPVLASVPADQQDQAATGVVNAIAHCIKAGQGVTPGPDDDKSWTLDLSGAVPSYASSPNSGGTQAPLLADPERLASLSGWWDSVQNDAESFFQGVRHDAVQIATCTANWVEAEAQWTVNLAVRVEKEIIGVADYVINDIKSAIDAVTGFFQTLGAEIGDVITWLRQNVGELIAEAGQNAKMIEGWLDQLPTIVNAKLTEIGQVADGFFAGLATRADQAIDELASDLGERTFGGSVPSPPSGVFDITKFLSGVQHNWLLDKIESFGFADTAVVQNADVQVAFDQLAVALQDGLQFVADLGETFYDALKTMFATGGSYQQTAIADFITQLKVTVKALLAFADAVVKALIDLAKVVMDQLGSMLSHGFEDLGLASKLLALFGVDTTMNVGHVVSLVLMYPATLANRIKRGSTTSLFPGVGVGQGELAAVADLDWAFGLGLSAAIGQGIWGVADSAGDLQRVLGKEPSGIVGWVDIVAPVILTLLEWPGTPAGPPFANPIDGSGPDGAMIWPNWLLGFMPPIVGLCGQFADYKPPAAVQVTEEEPEWPAIGQWFTMAAAIASTILGSIYNFNPATGQSAETQAASILGNVSNIIAPFATEEIAASTEGGSEIIKMFADYLCNMGAAGCMGAALEA